MNQSKNAFVWGLDERATLERFIWPSDIAARLRLERSRYVKKADGATLFILAPCGFGKSHLLQAIARDERLRNADAQVIYLTAATWNKRVRQGRSKALFALLCAADLLLLDNPVEMLAMDEINAIVAARTQACKRSIVAIADRQQVLRIGMGACFHPHYVIEFKRLTPSQIRRLIAQKASDFGVTINARQERRLASYRYRDVIDVMNVVGQTQRTEMQNFA